MENQNPQPSIPTQDASTAPVSNVSQTPPSILRTRSKMIIVLIILFSLLFLISAIALGMKFFNENKKNTVLIPPSSPSPTTNPNTDMLSYENTTYGFTVKYPKNWTILPSNNQDSDVDFSGPSVSSGEAAIVSIQVLETAKLQPGWEQNYAISPSSSKTFTNGNYTYYVTANTYTIREQPSEETKKIATDTMNQILSTLQFTQPTLDSNLKTYNGEHVIFSYPSTWGLEKNTPCCGALPFDDIKLGIPGSTGDQNLGFSSPDFTELDYTNALKIRDISIGSKKGKKEIKKLEVEGSDQKFRYSYCATGYENDGSFCVSVTSPTLDKTLEASLDTLVSSIRFK